MAFSSRIFRALIPSLLPLLVAAGPVRAQAAQGDLGGLGRPYVHVFLAYAIILLLVGAWAISIARRLSRIEKSLEEPGG